MNELLRSDLKVFEGLLEHTEKLIAKLTRCPPDRDAIQETAIFMTRLINQCIEEREYTLLLFFMRSFEVRMGDIIKDIRYKIQESN